jgi:hypothetical protein
MPHDVGVYLKSIVDPICGGTFYAKILIRKNKAAVSDKHYLNAALREQTLFYW